MPAGVTDGFFDERWKLNQRSVIGERLEFVDATGTVRWRIERKGICDAVFVRDDFVVVGSHEWKSARRPILSAYLKGGGAPLWVFDLNRVRTPKGRQSDYLSAAITEDSVFVYWVGVIFRLDRRSGVEISRIDCANHGLSGAMMNEVGILIPLPGSILLFHRQNVLCIDQNLDRVVWSHCPELEGNLLPSPLVDGGLVYFFRGRTDAGR